MREKNEAHLEGEAEMNKGDAMPLLEHSYVHCSDLTQLGYLTLDSLSQPFLLLPKLT